MKRLIVTTAAAALLAMAAHGDTPKDADRARELYDIAAVAVANGDFGMAEQKLIEAKKLMPDNALILYNLAIVQSKLGKIAPALDNVKAALAQGLGDEKRAAEKLRAELSYREEKARQATADTNSSTATASPSSTFDSTTLSRIREYAEKNDIQLVFDKFTSGLVYANDLNDLGQTMGGGKALVGIRAPNVAAVNVDRLLTESTAGQKQVEKVAAVQSLQAACAQLSEGVAKQRCVEDNQRAVTETRDRGLLELQNKIKPVIDSIAKERGLIAIFNRKESGIVYSSNSIDITDIILDRFNAVSKQ